jgi:hypothetical protein
MKHKLCCNRQLRPRTSSSLFLFAAVVLLLACVPKAAAGDAPQWMHSLVNAPLPAHDEKTNAVLLYSETIVSVQSADKIKQTVREAYRILRPDGREFGTVFVYLNSHRHITGLRG